MWVLSYVNIRQFVFFFIFFVVFELFWFVVRDDGGFSYAVNCNLVWRSILKFQTCNL